MSSDQIFQLGSFGQTVLIDMGDIDLTDYDEVYIDVMKPNGLTITWTAAVNQLDPGILSYEFLEDDLDQAGKWHAHGRVVYNAPASNTVIGEYNVFLVSSKYSPVCLDQELDVC